MSGIRIKVSQKDYTFFCYNRLSSHYSYYRIKPLPAHRLHCAFSGCCSVGGGLRQWGTGHLDYGKQSCSWSDTSNLRTIFAVLTVILQFWQIMLLRCFSVLPPSSAECRVAVFIPSPCLSGAWALFNCSMTSETVWGWQFCGRSYAINY